MSDPAATDAALLGVSEETISSLAAAARQTAASALAVLRTWLPGHEATARRDAAHFDAGLAELRCRLLAMGRVLRGLPAGSTAFKRFQADMRPVYEAYVRHATATYGSVGAARAHFQAAAPCAVGVALPAAAWYAAGAAITAASVAYAASYRDAVWRDVKMADARLAAGERLSACIRSGASESACLEALKQDPAERAANPDTPGGQVAQVAQGVGWLLLAGAAAVGAAAIFWRKA